MKKTYIINLKQVSKEKVNSFSVIFNEKIIGEVYIHTQFPNCFENPWFDKPIKVANDFISKLEYNGKFYGSDSLPLFNLDVKYPEFIN